MGHGKAAPAVLSAAILFIVGAASASLYTYTDGTTRDNTRGRGDNVVDDHGDIDWRDDSLALYIYPETTVISIDQRLNVTMELMNVGNSPIAVYPGRGLRAGLHDENDTGVPAHLCPVKPGPPPNDEEFNSRLIDLDPGEVIQEEYSFTNKSDWGDVWEIQPGHTYHAHAFFRCDDERGPPARPHWTGELLSEPAYFSVLA